MAIQTINVGNVVNDGLGDNLRTAFEKVNSNFSELNASLTVTASNIGNVGAGLFKEKVGADLQFKRLVSGTKIFIEELSNSLVINNQQPDGFVRIDTNFGTLLGNDFINITLAGKNGGENIETVVTGSVISIDTVIPVTGILTSFDFGPVAGNFEYTTQFALASANIDFGTTTLPAAIDLDLGAL